MKITKKIIKAIESLHWSVRKSDDGTYTLENFSPAGGDMVIEGVRTTEDIIEYCDNFDPDEEFDLWYGANRGEPSTPRELLRDCEAQAQMYDELDNVLRNADE